MSTVTVYSIESAQTSPATTAADVLDSSGSEWTDQADRARELSRWSDAGQWVGSASDAASHRIQSSFNRLDAMGLSSQAIGLMGTTHVGLIEVAQTAVRAALLTARAAFMQVTPQGVVTPGPAALIPEMGAAAQGLASSLTGVLSSAVTMVQTLDASSAGAVRVMSSTAQEVPEAAGVGVETIGTAPHGSSNTQDPPQVSQLDTPHGPVFVVGDVQAAESITTFVSGVGSSGEGASLNTTQWAVHEVEKARAEGKNIAVVAWHGYQAPSSIKDAISDGPARTAAPDLRNFQRGLRATNPDAHLNVVGYSYGSVVVGEAAETEGPGLEADTLRFLGSPGVGADSAKELNLATDGPGEVTSEHAPGDLIQLSTNPLFGVHGADPSSPGFGAGRGDGDGSSWSEYLWNQLMDGYIASQPDLDTHSSYLWDPSLDLTGIGTGTSPINAH